MGRAARAGGGGNPGSAETYLEEEFASSTVTSHSDPVVSESVERQRGNTLILVGQKDATPTPGEYSVFQEAAEYYQSQHGGIIAHVHNGEHALRVMAQYGQNGGIDHLVYFGHGSASAMEMSMSYGYNSMYTDEAIDRMVDMSIADSRFQLPKLYSARIGRIDPTWFNENATIEMRGCNMGQKFAQSLANHVGRGVTV